MFNTLLTDYPELFAIAIIVGGFLVAGLLAAAVRKLLFWLEQRFRQVVPSLAVMSGKTEFFIEKTVYYTTIAVFTVIALSLLGFGGFSELLALVIRFLPGVVTGISIVIIGYLLSTFVYHMMLSSLWNRGNTVVPRVAQALIMTMAVLTGLEQMSIDVSLIATTLMVLLTLTLGGLTLSFSLGSGGYVANLLARRVFDEFAVGDRVRMNDVEGTILAFTTTSVRIQTDEGIAIVPAKVFAESIVVRLTYQ